MTRKDDLRWLKKRANRWYFERRVPARVAHLDARTSIRISCDTGDLAQAVVVRDKLNAETEAYWKSLVDGAGEDVHDRYQGALLRARLEGFTYRPHALSDATVREIVDRVQKVEQAVARKGAGVTPDETQLVEAITGAVAEPPILISGLPERYEALTRDKRRGMSEAQEHKWRLPLLRAAKNFRDLVGDKPITAVSRADAIAFRDWWYERVEEEGLSSRSANKDLTHIGKMIALVSDRHDLDLPRRFRGLRFDDSGAKRPPYSTDFIRDRILAPGALDGLNATSRGVVLTMINTGARPGELVGLRPEDIHLDAEIPHLSIVAYQGRALKTKFSIRDMPLVGPSLEGAKLLKETGGVYKDRGGSLSANVNKYLSGHGLTDVEGQTLYSLRHSFKDRLTEADATDLVDAELMGHKFDRPDYGKGPTLAKKLEWVLKVAIYRPA